MTRSAPRTRSSVRRLAASRPETALFAAAAAGVAALAVAALAHPRYGRAHPLDRVVRRRLGAGWLDRMPPLPARLGGHHTRRHAVAEALGGLGGKWTLGIAGGAAALLVGRRHGPLAALPFLLASPGSDAVHGALKYVVRRPRPITAWLTGKRTPSFPSGHAARAAAAGGLLGWAAVRDGVLPARAAVPLAALTALAGGGGRVYVDRHWATDAVGGWGLGIACAALAAIWYERARAAPGAGDAGNVGDAGA